MSQNQNNTHPVMRVAEDNVWESPLRTPQDISGWWMMGGKVGSKELGIRS